MFAEISMARIKTAPEAASDLNWKKFEIEFLYPRYEDVDDDDPVGTPTGAENAECIWTWPEAGTVDSTIIVGRLVHGDWVVIAEAC